MKKIFILPAIPFVIRKQLLTTVFIIYIANSTIGQANTKLSNLVSPTAVNVHLLPAATNARNLGSYTFGWKNLYLRGNIYFAGNVFVKSKGTANNFFGSAAGRALTIGAYNTGIGHAALYHTTTGISNTASGAFALFNNIDGTRNTASGHGALFSNTSGNANTVFGFQAMYSNMTGSNNLAAGNRALFSHQSGCCNIALGTSALDQNVSGEANIAIGQSALYNATGNFNTAIGYAAGETFSSLSSSTLLGAFSYAGDGITNSTAIGYGASVSASNQVRIGNTNINSIGGQVDWSKLSDGRYKKNIKWDVPGLDFITQLKPLTYTLDIDGLNNTKKANTPEAKEGLQRPELSAEEIAANAVNAKVRYTGFIAQEVEEVAKKINYDFSGVDKPRNAKDFYGLRYAEFVVPLVKAVQELNAKNEDLQNQINELKSMIRNGGNGTTINSIKGGGYLKQNIPNPSKNNTVINYYLPVNAGRGQIRITDIKGSTLKAYNVSRGEGQVSIRGGELPSGTYNYTLYANDEKIDSKKMIITK